LRVRIFVNQLQDPGAMFLLVAGMELGIVRLFVSDHPPQIRID
jgi:hypothetical protein